MFFQLYLFLKIILFYTFAVTDRYCETTVSLHISEKSFLAFLVSSFPVYAVQVKANAEAEANKKISASLTKDLINYTQVNAWDGKLPVYNGGSSTSPIINFGETTEVED